MWVSKFKFWTQPFPYYKSWHMRNHPEWGISAERKIISETFPWEEWQKRKNQINNVQDKSWSWSTKKLIGLICLYHFINNSFLLPIQRTLTQKARYYSIWSKLNYTHSLWIYPHPCFISTLPLFLSKVPWILQEIYNILNACEFFPRIKS